MKTFVVSVVMVAVVGCGIGTNTKKDQVQGKDFPLTDTQGEQIVDGYGYELPGENCTTGFHGPFSLADYCSELVNEKKNQNCAKDARLLAHAQDCRTN
jgi:hypothetical protein